MSKSQSVNKTAEKAAANSVALEGMGGRRDKRVSIVSAADLPRNMSFEYNARSPSRGSRAYISMRETLANSPEGFLDLNGGITVANSTYILDGGHTYMAIMDAIREDQLDPKRVKVQVTDLGDITNEEMARRSVALNRRVTPPLVGEKDLEGVWNRIKTSLKGDYFKLYEFRPNTNPTAPYKVEFLVALMHAWTKKGADKAYSSKGQLVRLYKDDKYLKQLPLLNSSIEMWSEIYKLLLAEKKKFTSKISGFKENTTVTLPNGEEIAGLIPEAYVWPVYGAFEQLLDEKGEFTTDPIELFKKRKDKIIKSLLEDLKNNGMNPGPFGKDSKTYLNATIALVSPT